MIEGASAGEPSEHYTTLQNVRIDRVLWDADVSDAVKAPESLALWSTGWNQNRDTGNVSTLLPEDGPRIDVGDTFVAAFANDIHSTTDAFRETDSYTSRDTHWAVNTASRVLQVKNGSIESGIRSPDYEQRFDGMSVDSFTEELTVALEDQQPGGSSPGA